MQITDEMIEAARKRIIFALDVESARAAEPFLNYVTPYSGLTKVGLELITAGEAPEVIAAIKGRGSNVLYDGKFDDIPNTVGRATKRAASYGVAMINVHASAGKESIKAAVTNKDNSLIIGVTVLTSIDEAECISIFGDKPGRKVVQFAEMLLEVGADGIICSPKELELLGRDSRFDRLIKITPGVRPEWADADDQKRVMRPGEAIKAGAMYIVIGRPISNPPKKIGTEVGTPAQAVRAIAIEIATAMAST